MAVCRSGPRGPTVLPRSFKFMCGIAGAWLATPSATEEQLLTIGHTMTDPIAHRGPDADGHWASAELGLVLGHRRLSIIDLSPAGAQPMVSASGRFVIVFNGEIYNFRALREELAASGAAFKGGSDTEVLLAGFEAWGIGPTIRRAAGMFALAVWDRDQRSLSLVRDRIGEKPLYVASGPKGLLFGSELKAMTALRDRDWSLHPEAVSAVLRFGYIPAPLSIYSHVRKLRAGEIFTYVTASADPTVDRYWDARSMHARATTSPYRGSESDAVEDLEVLLGRVVREEMVSDVPLGAFLSGGIDSSLITAIMQANSSQPIRTFTIGFENGAFNEAPFARAVAEHLGTSHTEVMLASNAALPFVERLPHVYDEPFADSSQLPTMLVSAITRGHVTVALSGDGGDEIFSGYTQYVNSPDRISRAVASVPTPLRGALASLYGMAPEAGRMALVEAARSANREPALIDDARLRRAICSGDAQRSYEDRIAIWPDTSLVLGNAMHRELRGDAFWLAGSSVAEQRMLHDLQTYLPDDICVKVDRAGMASSLETRAPFLHHEVVEFAWSLPLHHKRVGTEGKRILRQLLGKHVPTSFFEREKRGFAVPLGDWLRAPLLDWAGELFNELPAELALKQSRINRIWRAHLSGREDWSRQLWPLLMLLQWYRAQVR